MSRVGEETSTSSSILLAGTRITREFTATDKHNRMPDGYNTGDDNAGNEARACRVAAYSCWRLFFVARYSFRVLYITRIQYRHTEQYRRGYRQRPSAYTSRIAWAERGGAPTHCIQPCQRETETKERQSGCVYLLLSTLSDPRM